MLVTFELTNTLNPLRIYFSGYLRSMVLVTVAVIPNYKVVPSNLSLKVEYDMDNLTIRVLNI